MDKRQQFVKGKFTEEELEHAIIELFQEEGWNYVHGESLHRRYEDVLMEDVLANSLRRRYSDLSLTGTRAKSGRSFFRTTGSRR